MITLQRLKWNNVFSYGKGNEIEFDKYQIVQLLGKNGHGKSSIGLILEEVLYNKNSKGIKKGDILNRYVSDKSYSIELTFEKDADQYEIKVTRGSTQTVKLLKNGDDISSHTATNTFKTIEEIIGVDHKTFSQLIYQSSSSSLEFLTATDTNRKKFLIDLLNLNKYVEAFEVFKSLAKEVEDEVKSIETKISTTKAWLDKHGKELLEIKEFYPVLQPPEKDREKLAELSSSLKTISATNKRISQNNEYIKLQKAIPVEALSKVVPQPEDTTPLVKEIAEQETVIKNSKAFIKRINDMPDACPTCKQSIDKSQYEASLKEEKDKIESASLLLKSLEAKLHELEKAHKEFKRIAQYKSDWESYHSLIDAGLPSELIDKEEIEKSIKELQEAIQNIESEITSIEKKNRDIAAHNSKVEVISEQMSEMKKDMEEYSEKLKIVSDKLSTIQLLQKTFGTNGLVAFKIECLVKDLEELTNKYLAELSDGRFQLYFKVVSDKLNVIITDNGKDIDILALSSGEKARVNTSTLLAIRKLMQNLSKTRINLLILDETIENLDVDGKEKLIEVLVQEEHLNTILISHGYTHPLLEKLSVIKENNISRIE
jgi:DNA repair exonuclease SbcCD ATPase subunit